MKAKFVAEVSVDTFFEELKAPGIVGPAKGAESSAWLVYFPGTVPCICDTFESAAEMMGQLLKKKRRSR